ncbi:zinc finger protein 597 [Dama dama]|uniref:zinc finger protein 597 n=1 Tax=Dama dama TaxID=30532 RepID=UPI002A35A2A5|nr:zinc finger protein 597 [Dama dama]
MLGKTEGNYISQNTRAELRKSSRVDSVTRLSGQDCSFSSLMCPEVPVATGRKHYHHPTPPHPQDGIHTPYNRGPDNQQLHLESMGLEELALEKCSLAVPLICYPEKSSEHGAGNFERKISGGTPACTKRFRSLLVTIENHTPLIELAQSLGTRALPEILPFPEEGTKKSYKCPECDQSFSHSSCLVLHQKTHAGKKKCKCDDCRKIFNHRSNLRAHKIIHTGEKPYKCAQCGGSFRRPSHLSQHRKAHPKEKIHRCGICGRGFTRLRGLSQHQKTHTATKASNKYVGQKTNLALPEEKHGSAAQQPCSPGRKCFGQPSYPCPGEATRTI